MPKHSKRFQKFPPKKHKIPERKNRKRTHTQKKMKWNVLECFGIVFDDGLPGYNPKI
jgi:hypothetical protein